MYGLVHILASSSSETLPQRPKGGGSIGAFPLASDEESRELGTAIARKLRCAPRAPDPCWRDPLTNAYRRPLGGLVRALAPQPVASIGPTGTGLVPVDFRYCRQPTCAAPGREPGLTASGRRVTEFTSAEDLRPAGPVRITYWLYRPGLGWQRIERTAGVAEIAAAAGLWLSVEDDPALVPLETLPARDHYSFPPVERPPWQWTARGSTGRTD